MLSHAVFATPLTVAHQAPLSMGFSRQKYWNGLLFPSSSSFFFFFAVPFFRGSSRPWRSGIKPRSSTLWQILYHLSHQEKCFSLSGSKESNSGRRMCYQEGRFWLEYENWNHLNIEWVPQLWKCSDRC